MSTLKNFMFDAADDLKDEVFPSSRFKQPFVIRAISETRNEELRKSNTRTVINKRMGRKERNIDQDGFISDMVLECIVEPDLKNKELQSHYKTPGDPSATLKKMLLPGESTNLVEAIQELNGYDSDIEELRDEAKKD